jgi:hypothetical protein
MKRLGWLFGALLLAAGAALAQTGSLPRWRGALMGIADQNGNQFSSANPLPVTTTPGSGSQPVTGTVTTNPGVRTIIALDVNTVTTGGTAVTALATGHRTAGGWIYNPSTATVNLCISEIGAASGTTSQGNLTCIPPDRTYQLSPSTNAVSVVSSDALHPFSGYGLQ